MVTKQIQDLTIPGKPEDLLDMYELRDRIVLQKQLNDNIINYIRTYHNSFLKNEKEMTDILPDHTINEYHIMWLNQLGREGKEKADNYEWKYECELQYDTYYLTNYKERIVYNCYPIAENNRNFYYEQQDNILLVRQVFERHSSRSRSYNPCILSKYCQISIFDLKTNEALYSALYSLEAKFSGYLEDNHYDYIINDFLKADRQHKIYNEIKNTP